MTKPGVTQEAYKLLLILDTVEPSPFIRRDKRLFLRFDSIRVKVRGHNPEATCYWGSVPVYVFSFNSSLLGDYLRLDGFTGEAEMHLAEV